jgi:hypothetical protein
MMEKFMNLSDKRKRIIQHLRNSEWKEVQRGGYRPQDLWRDPVTKRSHYWKFAIRIQTEREFENAN